MKHRVWMASIGLCFWAAAVGVKDVFRPSVWEPSLVSKLLLESAPSFLSASAVPLLLLACHPRPSKRSAVNAGLLASGIVTAAEWLERFLPGSVFDWRDWLAALTGVLLGVLAAWMSLGRVAPSDSVER